MTIEALSAMEILDSRGRPTVQATVRLRDGQPVVASVPSGASTGSAEALELRDKDATRYGGLGCRRAVANVKGEIAKALVGREFPDQAALDRALIALDGTENKSRLGANAILAVSIAFARASAASKNVPLYQHFADMIGQPLRTLPRLTVNLFSGGKHAGGQVPIQDVLVVPASARTIDDGLSTVYAVYQAAARLTNEKYNARALKADEGGLAPPFNSIEEMLDDAVESIRAAGFRPGEDVALALDVASTHFYDGDVYHLPDGTRNAAGMIEMLTQWVNRWRILSLEDGLHENDWSNWPALNRAVGDRCLVLADDFLCTNPARIRRAIEANAANALLLKVNQIGTLTEATESLKLARDAGWRVTISARSGETEDNWLADLAVGWGGDQIKVGSIAQSERLAKYNRLLAIEAETNLPVVQWCRPRDPAGR
jgi:enolase